MMKRNKKIILIIAGIIILSNVFPLTHLLRIAVDEGHYRYSNYNGSVTLIEFMERGLDMMKNRHSACLLAQPSLKDKRIYRLFSKNPLAFWRWGLYFFDGRYQFPYKSWEEIKKTRDTEKLKKITGCTMDF